MIQRFLVTSLMVLAGALIGLISGAIIGAGLGSIVDALLQPRMREYALFGGAISALVGLIVAAGTIILGVRTDAGLEWALIVGMAIPLGLWIADTPWGSTYGLRLSAIATPAGWLVVHIIRRVFGKKLPGGSIQPWVLAVYLLIFILVIVIAPIFLMSVHVGLGI